MERQLQLNGLPIEGELDEISTHDFADNGAVFVLKPEAGEIFEFTGVKMDFDSKLIYKSITVSLFAHGVTDAVDSVEYKSLKNWKHKSHRTSLDDYTFDDRKIVTYERDFSSNFYLVADDLAPALGGVLDIPGLERVEISVQDNEPLKDIDGNAVEIVQGRYDFIRYKANEQNKIDWGL